MLQKQRYQQLAYSHITKGQNQGEKRENALAVVWRGIGQNNVKNQRKPDQLEEKWNMPISQLVTSLVMTARIIFLTTSNDEKIEGTSWCVDSGASQHMINKRELIENYREFLKLEIVRLSDDREVKAYSKSK